MFGSCETDRIQKIKTSRAKIPFIYLNGNMKKRLLL